MIPKQKAMDEKSCCHDTTCASLRTPLCLGPGAGEGEERDGKVGTGPYLRSDHCRDEGGCVGLTTVRVIRGLGHASPRRRLHKRHLVLAGGP